MVFFLERNDRKSFGERTARGLAKAAKEAPEAYKTYQDYKDRKAADLDKRVKGARKFGDEYIERFHPGIYENEKSYNSFHDRMKKYTEAGYSEDEALKASLGEISTQTKSGEANFAGEKPKLGRRDSDKDKLVGGWLGRFLEPAKEAIKKNPAVLASELPVAAAKSQKNLEAFHDPGSGLLTGLAKTFFPQKFNKTDEQGRPLKPNTVENMLAGQFRRGMPEEDREGAERVSDIESALLDLAIPLPGLKGGKALSPKSVAEKALSGASKAGQNLKMRQGATLGEAVFDDLFKRTGDNVAKQRLAKVEAAGRGKVTGALPKGPTVSRVERAAPESKLFKTAEQQAIREKQLKLHPEYAEEIAKDAAERAARAEAKKPKTLVGEAGVAKRMMIAEKELPKAKEMYQKAVARVRGLESELSRGLLPEHQARFEALYDAAVKELNEAEFYMKTVVNNAKLGEARVGIDAMRDAARNKMIQLEEKISAGETPELSLKDYNPKFIKEAKALEKRKPLPATRHEDYFTQVHEGYANEYRNRIADLENKAAENISRQPTEYAKADQRRLIDKKKETLQKLVDHVEAENTIHRHKMALREIEQRKVAQERLGKFTKQAGEQKVKELAKEALKSPEKAAEAVDTAFEEVANRTKNQIERDRILKERGFVKKKLEQEAKNMQEGVGIGKSTQEASQGATTAKEAAGKAGRLTRDFKEVMESLRNGGKGFFKTKIGKDLLWGVGIEIASQAAKGEELPVSISTVSAVASGSRGVYRYVFAQMTRWIWKKGQKAEYKRALQEGNDEKLIKLREKMPPKLRKEAIEEYRQELNA